MGMGRVMKGPGLVSVLMLLSVAVLAYAEASPRSGQREASLFGRSVPKSSCPLGSRYSSFYSACTRSFVPVSMAAH